MSTFTRKQSQLAAIYKCTFSTEELITLLDNVEAKVSSCAAWGIEEADWEDVIISLINGGEE